MSVIRVHKNKNFTVMSNVHLRDKDMSLKAKGLLSVMLSLPDDWSYSIGGLCSICKENETAIKSALKELKQRRYVIVEKHKPSKENNGRFWYEYSVYEKPQPEEKSKNEKQGSEKQDVENLDLENLDEENHPLYKSTDISNTDKENNTTPSPTELNTFSKEKGYSPAGLNTSLSEERAEKRSKRENNKFKWIVVKNHIISVMEKFGYDSTSEETEAAIEVFRYYYMEYKRKTGHNHPNLNDKTMRSVLERFLEGTEEVAGGDADDHMAMIEEHFCDDTHYGMDIDWNIQHFMTEDIRNYLYQRIK